MCKKLIVFIEYYLEFSRSLQTRRYLECDWCLVTWKLEIFLICDFLIFRLFKNYFVIFTFFYFLHVTHMSLVLPKVIFH